MASATAQDSSSGGRGGVPAHSGKMQTVKTDLKYLTLGSKAGVAPSSLTTRSALTTTRYVARYVIRRLIRYAKYAAVGAIVAAIGGTLLGTLGGGLAFFAAPSIPVGMGIGLVTALVKFGWRHRGNRFRGGAWERMKARAAEGKDGAKDEELDAEAVKQEREREWHKKREDVWMRI